LPCGKIIGMIKRYLAKEISADLKEKMVFLGGPRQVGKTTFARQLIGKFYRHPAYYNWDSRSDRRDIVGASWPAESDLVIFDEIHKYKKWKNLVKGLYDKYKEDFDILVTGSARLDIYRKGGDSLQGRYHYYRLHPLSLAELLGKASFPKPGGTLEFYQTKEASNILKRLLVYGGFPEPFIAHNEKTLRRWHNERLGRLFREDIRDTETIRDLGSMELLGTMLPEKAAGLLSINALREDLEISYKAVKNWIELLERFYYHFRVYPFSAKKIRSLKKEAKIYLWDWSEIEDESKRFENLIAGHLLKLVHYLRDAEGYKTELYFLRDTDGREVDFLVTINQLPWFAVEVKREEQKISPHLHYFAQRIKIPFLYQVVLTPGIDKKTHEVRLISADKFLSGLI
jgi:predicted AAA+ superfamily ATPase